MCLEMSSDSESIPRRRRRTRRVLTLSSSDESCVVDNVKSPSPTECIVISSSQEDEDLNDVAPTPDCVVLSSSHEDEHPQLHEGHAECVTLSSGSENEQDESLQKVNSGDDDATS